MKNKGFLTANVTDTGRAIMRKQGIDGSIVMCRRRDATQGRRPLSCDRRIASAVKSLATNIFDVSINAT
jgi:hypothetical protein